MKRKLIVLLLVLSSIFLVFGANPDSCNYYLAAADSLQDVSLSASMSYAFKALNSANKIKDDYVAGKARLNLGKSYLKLGNFPKAEQYLQMAIEEKNDSLRLEINLELALLYKMQGRYDSALSYFLKSLPLAEKADLVKEQLIILVNVASIYGSYDNREDGEKFLRKAQKIAAELADDPSALEAVALFQSTAGDYLFAEEYLQKALERYRRLGQKAKTANAALQLGKVYEKEEKFKEANEYFRQAYALSENLVGVGCRIQILYRLGKGLVHLQAYPEAISYLQKADMACRQGGFKELERDISLALSSAYEAEGQTREALTAFKRYESLNRELFSTRSAFEIAEMHARFESETGQMELKKQKEITLGLVIFIIVILLVALAMIYDKHKINLQLDSHNMEIEKMGFEISRQHQEALLQKEKLTKALEDLTSSEKRLKEANAAKDKFFNIIAHDLKNPFMALVGLSELLVNQAEHLNKEQISLFGKQILESSQRTFNLLQNLLQWARSQTGKLKWEPVITDLSRIAMEVVYLSAQAASNKRIELVNTLTEEYLIYADENMINTVIRNLVSNAIKYTQEGGKVVLAVARQKESINFTVTDTGIGIPQAALAKLFKIDENVSTPGTAQETGTGLGLILCKEFVEKNGGKIEVESEENRGSRFCITLPAHM